MARPCDVFLSYRRSDAEAVGQLTAALEARGVKVWLDETHVEEFRPVTKAVQEAIHRSRALIAYYSSDYRESSACLWELIEAFTAAQRLGDPRQRVLVVNPEHNPDHIEPVELRDAHYPSLADTVGPARFEASAPAVARHVRATRWCPRTEPYARPSLAAIRCRERAAVRRTGTRDVGGPFGTAPEQRGLDVAAAALKHQAIEEFLEALRSGDELEFAAELREDLPLGP